MTSKQPYVGQGLSYEQLVSEKAALGDLEEIVSEFLARKTWNIFVGDSGLGKTPLILQLALCVAFGMAFLNQKVERGRVLVIDYENPDLLPMLDALAEYLGIPLPLDNEWFRVLQNPLDINVIAKEIAHFQPTLITVDALRGMCPDAEKSREAAGLIKACSLLSKKFDCSWAVIHHPRKGDRKSDTKPDLFKDELMIWLEEAAGTRALINQSFTRVGIARPDGGVGDLGLRYNFKGRGDSAPWLLDRVVNCEGNPVGYTRIAGVDQLSVVDKELLDLIPVGKTLRFKEVMDAVNADSGSAAHRKTVSKFLKRCFDYGLVTTTGKPQSPNRRYTRVAVSSCHKSTTPIAILIDEGVDALLNVGAV